MNSVIDFFLNNIVIVLIVVHVLMVIFWLVWEPGFWLLWWLLTFYFIIIFFYSAQYLSWQIYTDPQGYLVSPFTLFNVIMSILLFYSFVYIFGISMTPASKDFWTSLTEGFLWLFLIVILFVDFFYYVFGGEVVSFVKSDYNAFILYIREIMTNEFGYKFTPSGAKVNRSPSEKESFLEKMKRHFDSIFSINTAPTGSPTASSPLPTAKSLLGLSPTVTTSSPPITGAGVGSTTSYGGSGTPAAAGNSTRGSEFMDMVGVDNNSPPLCEIVSAIENVGDNISNQIKQFNNPNNRGCPSTGANNVANTNNVAGATPAFSGKKEVFHIAENRYTYREAQSVCRSLGVSLATYDQIEEAYNHGADWYNYGWSQGQYAYFPMQKDTWKKLMEGEDCSAKRRASKMRPGIAGGYFTNPNIRFGINCYGVKPPKREGDNMVKFPYHSAGSPVKARDANVHIDSFNSNKWSEY